MLVIHGNIPQEQKVYQFNPKLVACDNMYMVGQRMNQYFVDFLFHPFLIVACDLSNATKGKIIANVVYN
jgi:hypothetical protein